MNEATKKKETKGKGPIRFEAILPVLILSLLTFAYFSFYFDRHMKRLVEFIGTQVNGAEVNVGSFRTSFLRGTFDMERLQVTDKNIPERNIIEIGGIHFGYMWDALLRMKFVVENASIDNIQLYKPRQSPGKVLPPEPAKPSKLDEMRLEVMSQVKNKYGSNMLGDLIALAEGGDYKDQIQQIRETLKSETRVNEMIADVEAKNDFWNDKVKILSDTSKLKTIEAELQSVQKEKNLVKQAQSISRLNDLLNDVHSQYKEIEKSSKQLQSELKAISGYPAELQNLVNQDIASLKNRFSIPKLDLKDMAMSLFSEQFAEYMIKARTYQALAKQYLPEKKEEKDEVVPRKRSQGTNYQFPITKGYPLFWLKRAAISSTGTADSYSGKVSGELTNVTTSPKLIGKPIVLDMKGDFPGVQVTGVKALFTVDFTRAPSKQSALLQVNSFPVPERILVNDKNLKFGFKNANGTSTISANLQEDKIKMAWNSAINKPNFLIETENKVIRESLHNIVNNIPVININGTVAGTFSNFDMNISSNLGDELAQGFSREFQAKVAEAQNKINALVDEKINKPKAQLNGLINVKAQNLNDLGNLAELYKKNEKKIEAEIDNLKKGGTNKAVDDLKEKGKKVFKGIKL